MIVRRSPLLAVGLVALGLVIALVVPHVTSTPCYDVKVGTGEHADRYETLAQPQEAGESLTFTDRVGYAHRVPAYATTVSSSYCLAWRP